MDLEAMLFARSVCLAIHLCGSVYAARARRPVTQPGRFRLVFSWCIITYRMTVLRIAACLAIGGAILAQPLQSIAERALRIPFVPDSRILRKVSPVYPHAAIQRRIQGTVCFAALIGQDGRVEHLRLLSGHPLLIVAAREAAQQWAYVPATVRGIPVRVITQIQIHFALDQYVKPGKVARATPRGPPLYKSARPEIVRLFTVASKAAG